MTALKGADVKKFLVFLVIVFCGVIVFKKYNETYGEPPYSDPSWLNDEWVTRRP